MPSVNLLNHLARVPISSSEAMASLLVKSPLPSAISLTIMTVSLIGPVIERFMVIPKKRNTAISKIAVIITKPVNIS